MNRILPHSSLILILLAFQHADAEDGRPSVHQREWQWYRDHPELIGSSVAPRVPAKRPDLLGVQQLTSVVYGFHPYWQNGSEANYYFSLLTHLAYFSADIDPATGSFSNTHSWASAAVVDDAKAYGLKVHLTLTLFSNHSTLLNSDQNRLNLISNTLSLINQRNADGCNVDFESMGSSVAASYRSFILQLGDSLKAHGKELVVELPAVDWNSIFTSTFFSTVGSVVDYYFLMAYDYYWSGSSTAGPVSPLCSGTSEWHIMRSIDTYLSRGVGAGKLLSGFPYYGYDWPVTSSARMASTTGTGSSRTYTTVVSNYLDTIATENKFASDSWYNVPWYRYQRTGSWRQCWYDDSLSLAKKYDSVKTRSIAGVGMWALGYDGSQPELWGALKSAFALPPNPLHATLADFESSVGAFDKSPTYSGTTVGISQLSTSARSRGAAHCGWSSLRVLLRDSAGLSTDWRVRLLSGTGSPGNNVPMNVSCYVGFWLMTTSAPPGASVALSIDDGAGGTLISTQQTVVNDGSWNLYQWDLAATSWTILSGSDTVLNGPTCTLDAIMFYAPNGSPDWTIFMDDVRYRDGGPLPVRLASFGARPTERGIELRWRTLSEVNNYGFFVERSTTESGEYVVLPGAFLPGHGTTTIPAWYSYLDEGIGPGMWYYRLRQVDLDGTIHMSDPASAEFVAATASVWPEGFALMQNYPNPFNPATTIRFTIGGVAALSGAFSSGVEGPAAGKVRLVVYDILGREVATLVNERKAPGSYSIRFDGSNLASGVYIYRLTAGRYGESRTMALIK